MLAITDTHLQCILWWFSQHLNLTCHCEYSDEEADTPSGQHDFLFRIISGLFLLGCPDADSQNHNIEDDDGDNSADVDHLDSILLFPVISKTRNIIKTYLYLGNVRIARNPPCVIDSIKIKYKMVHEPKFVNTSSETYL